MIAPQYGLTELGAWNEHLIAMQEEMDRLARVLTVADIKRVVGYMRANALGTVYLKGKRQYVAVRGKGFVEPGVYKEQLRVAGCKK